MLARRIALLSPSHCPNDPHPYCSEPYARASEEAGVQSLYVPEWGAYVLMRKGSTGACHAEGVRPLEPLNPNCDVRAGLYTLQRAGISSVALITDPMWTPELSALQHAFDTCRVFKEHYFVDREAEVRIRKGHRNQINQARRACYVQEISLAEHLDHWLALYKRNVTTRQILRPFGTAYFESLAGLPALRTLAVTVKDAIVSMSLWIRHNDTLYFHDGASDAKGFEISAAYAAFAYAIENAGECRYVLLGGSAGIRDERLDGLAMFKRGFSNSSAVSYLCSANLN